MDRVEETHIMTSKKPDESKTKEKKTEGTEVLDRRESIAPKRLTLKDIPISTNTLRKFQEKNP